MSLPYDVVPKVLTAISEFSKGYSLTRACIKAGITIHQFRRCVAQNAELQEAYEEAEQMSHDALADALLEIDVSEHGSSDSKMANVLSNNIKWVLSKRDQKRFGDKMTVDVNVSMDRAITAALAAAKDRVALPAPDIIDAVVVSEDDAEIMRQLLE